MVPDPKNVPGNGIFLYQRRRGGQCPILNCSICSELVSLGLAKAEDVEDGVVIRQAKAYPVYDHEYRKHLAVIQNFLATIDNLQTTGRNGMHRYNRITQC